MSLAHLVPERRKLSITNRFVSKETRDNIKGFPLTGNGTIFITKNNNHKELEHIIIQ